MKRRLGQTRIRFTPTMWAKWHSRDAVGIQTFRSLLAGRDVLVEWERRP